MAPAWVKLAYPCSKKDTMACGRTLAKFLQNLGLAFALGLAFLLPLAPGAHAQNFSDLSFEQISEIAGLTSDKVTPIRRARLIAAQNGFDLATYGGTSRELLRFIQSKMDSLGGYAQFKQWVSSLDELHLFDWHKINSDLDLMLVPNSKTTPTPDALENTKKLIANIQKEIPGDMFFKKLDIQIAEEFLNDPKFKPQAQHLEAISNIPIGSRGIIEHEALKVATPSGDISLPRSGVQQLRNKKFDFALNPNLKPAGNPDHAFDQFKQVLRWIRYASEFPDIELTEQSKQNIQTVLQDLRTNHKSAVLELLKSGDAELRTPGGQAKSKGGKIIEALEKAQLYSGDSNKTRKLLDDFRITQLADEAQVKATRIFDPLPKGTPNQTKLSGKTVRFKHRTSLAAAQNMSQGALWISNGTMIVGGKQSGNLHGSGLYMAQGFGQSVYGTYAIDIDVPAEHLNGSGDVFVARSRAELGSIGSMTYEGLLTEFLAQIKRPQITPDETEVLSKSIMGILDPINKPKDRAVVADLIEHFRRTNPSALEQLVIGFATRPSNRIAIAAESGNLVHDSKILKEIFGELPPTAKSRVTLEILTNTPVWTEREWKKVPALLTDANPNVREVMFGALGRQPNWPEGFLQKVPALLADTDPEVGEAMVRALKNRPKWPKSFRQKVPALLAHKDHRVRLAMVDAVYSRPNWLKTFRQYVPDLLTDPDPNVRNTMARVLRIQPNWHESFWQYVPDLLTDPDPNVRNTMAWALEYQPHWPENVWQKVLAVLADSENHVREAMIITLAKRPRWTKSFRQKVPALLADTDPEVRAAMVRALQNQPN